MQCEAWGATECAGALVLRELICAGAPTPQQRAHSGEMLKVQGIQFEL